MRPAAHATAATASGQPPPCCAHRHRALERGSVGALDASGTALACQGMWWCRSIPVRQQATDSSRASGASARAGVALAPALPARSRAGRSLLPVRNQIPQQCRGCTIRAFVAAFVDGSPNPIRGWQPQPLPQRCAGSTTWAAWMQMVLIPLSPVRNQIPQQSRSRIIRAFVAVFVDVGVCNGSRNR